MEKYIVKLTHNERGFLLSLISKGKAAAQKLTHARILLEVDENTGEQKTDGEVAEMFHISNKTVQRVRTEFVENGIECALERKKHSNHKPRKIQGEQEAHLIAICCSTPPEGRCRWTMKLLHTLITPFPQFHRFPEQNQTHLWPPQKNIIKNHQVIF